jgi:predicted transcriptional regulator
MMDWFEEEMEALERQLMNGAISHEDFNKHVRELRRDAQEQEDREDIIAAGRGHLLR